MGVTWNSFKREMGKNTGKAVSNLIFGDAHSTPYRRTNAPRPKSNRQIAAEHAEARLQQDLAHQEYLRKMELKEQRERLKREKQLVEDTIQRENKKEQEEYEEAKLTAIADHLKFVRGIIFENSHDAYNYLADITTEVDLLDWDLKTKTDNKKLIGLNQKLCDAYFDKYSECLHLSIELLTDSQREFHKQNLSSVEKKKASLKGMFNVASLYANRILKSETNVTRLIELLSTNNNPGQIPVAENTPPPPPILPNAVQMISEETIPYNFIDLNENGRIETRLAQIWQKYGKKVGPIATRRPIFVCDSPEDSILFVGVNPSYFESDDNVLIHSKDDKSLYYECLYGEENIPQYFKMLDAFTKDVSQTTPYAHINLLYAREDNRDHLLSLDHNFIREQLELTYDTIVKINPKVILFFSNYCKDMIFGPQRWVDPASHTVVTDSYLLNGTRTPVLFTEDLHLLSESEIERLEKRIKTLID